jgi:hypothetical protein
MSASIKLPFDVEATLTDGIWTCADAEMQELLQRTFPLWKRSGADPNPERTAAEFAVSLFGGAVVSVDPIVFDPTVVY